MTYRTVLVHLDRDARCSARVGFALQLARQFNAHLIGLAATGELVLPAGAGTREVTELADRVRQEQRVRAQGLIDAFRTQAAAAGHADCEALLVGGSAEEAIVRHGRWSDLLVLSQHDENDAGNSVPPDFLQNVFMACGRPVLMVPRARAVKTTGTRICVAWSATRESARAMADALPLLQSAAQVIVLNLDRPNEAGLSRLELRDLQHVLKRQGVGAECLQVSTSENYGDTLLTRAVGAGADLIVMGGFGHSRWAELVLGGVTRTVLTKAVVPVLLSH